MSREYLRSRNVVPHLLHSRKLQSRSFSLFLFLGLCVASAQATSVVILRAPRGARIVVAADSQFSVDSHGPVDACKILQIEKRYWTAVSGLVYEPNTRFNAYQIALDASARHKDSLDQISSEVLKKTLATLPAALRRRHKTMGNKAFWKEYKIGRDAHEEAFWGFEDGELHLIYIQYVLQHWRFGFLRLQPLVHKCPGDACPNSDSGFGAFLGDHKVIDRFTAANQDWKRENLGSVARQFVEMEIDHESDCHCERPVSVLNMDRIGNASWIGEKHPSCQAPK